MIGRINDTNCVWIEPTRPDWIAIKVAAWHGEWNAAIALTNRLLKLEHLEALPDGLVNLQITTVHEDGTESKPMRVLVKKGPEQPEAPTVQMVVISFNDEAVRRVRQSRALGAPLEAVPIQGQSRALGAPKPPPLPPVPEPLRSFLEHRERLNSGERRNAR